MKFELDNVTIHPSIFYCLPYSWSYLPRMFLDRGRKPDHLTQMQRAPNRETRTQDLLAVRGQCQLLQVYNRLNSATWNETQPKIYITVTANVGESCKVKLTRMTSIILVWIIFVSKIQRI